MAYTTIDDPTAYFQCELWTGNGSARSITLSGNSDLQPDMVWLKQRSGTENHNLYDSVRGAGKRIIPNLTNSESTTNELTAFNSDGFSLADGDEVNKSSSTYVSWNWKETADAGFDIVSYAGNDTARTISHSLSAVPKMMIVKCRNVGKEWTIFHASQGNGKFIELDNNSAVQTATNRWNDTSPTSSVFTVGVDSSVNAADQTYIAYLFAEKQGYSKFGTYIGNANADGPFVYTGFMPAFVICKKSSASGDWELYDNKRNGFNNGNVRVIPNANDAETGTGRLSLLSNGFKITTSSGNLNTNSATYIFMAFAESPFVTSTGVPTTAR